MRALQRWEPAQVHRLRTEAALMSAKKPPGRRLLTRKVTSYIHAEAEELLKAKLQRTGLSEAAYIRRLVEVDLGLINPQEIT